MLLSMCYMHYSITTCFEWNSTELLKVKVYLCIGQDLILCHKDINMLYSDSHCTVSQSTTMSLYAFYDSVPTIKRLGRCLFLIAQSHQLSLESTKILQDWRSGRKGKNNKKRLKT